MIASPAAAPVHRFEAAGLGTAPFTLESFQVSKWQACPGAPIQAGSSCDYCGQAIMLVFVLRGADGRRFKVGCDCVEKAGDAGLINAVRAQRQAHTRELTKARAERTRQAKRLKREEAAKLRHRQTRAQANAFALAHELIPAFRVALRGPKRALAADLLRKLRAMGELSPAQTRLVRQLGVRLVPAPVGRVTFTGTIEAMKLRDFGPIKMTVLADDGFRVWVTAPQSIVMAYRMGQREDVGTFLTRMFVGRRVQLAATLEPSKDEPGFAFGKRPTAKLLEPVTG